MLSFFSSLAYRLALLALLACVARSSSIMGAEDPPPDPAQHGAIVPYDGKQPPNLEQANRFYLDYQDFQRLWDLAKSHRQPAVPTDDDLHAVPSVSVVNALYRGETFEDHVHFDAQFEVVSHGQWAKWVPLAEQKAVQSTDSRIITALRLDGQPISLDDTGAIVLAQPGQHHVELSITFTTKMNEDWKQFSWARPQSAAALLELTVSDSEGTPVFPYDHWSLEQHRDGKRVFIVPLSDHPLVILRRRVRKIEPNTPPAVVFNTLQLTASPRMDEVDARLNFNFLGTARDHFTVHLDDNLRVRSWSVPDLLNATLRHANGEMIAELQLSHPVADNYTVELVAERPSEALTGRRPAPRITGAAVQGSTTLHVRASTDLAVHPEPSPETRQITTESPTSAEWHDVGTWRMDRASSTFAYNVAPALNHRVAKLQTLYQLTRQKAEIISVLSLDLAKESIQEIRIDIPKGYEVQTFTGPQLRGWHREGDTLLVQMNPASQQATLTLHLAHTALQLTTHWPLEPIRLPDYSKYQGRTFVAVHVADDVQMKYAGQQARLRELDPASAQSSFSVSPPFTLSRAFDVESADWTAEVILNRPPARYAADAVLLAQVTDTSVTFSQHIGIQIERGALDNIKLRLPKELPEARVDGGLVRDAQSRIDGADREYQITFQSEVLDRAEFSLNYELPLTGSKTLPVVQAVGADRLRTFIIVDNASSRELHLQSGDAEPIVSSSLPYVPQGLERPQFFQPNPKSQLSFSLTQLDSSAAQSAIVTFAEITTDLRPNGERWNTVVYSLINHSLQFLPVLLPQDAQLVEVSVSHQSTRADLDAHSPQGKTVYLVPLIQMRPGELSQEVRLVYRYQADARNIQLQQAELLNMSVERTLWHVHTPEGYELRSNDTNMEPVNATAAENEKSQLKLEEVARLNRLLQSHALSDLETREALNNASNALAQVKASSAAQGQKEADGAAKLAAATRAQTDLMQKNAPYRLVYKGQYQSSSDAPPKSPSKVAEPSKVTNWASQGSGQIIITNANTYTGNTSITAGTLVLNDNVAVDQGVADKSKAPALRVPKEAPALATYNARASQFQTEAKGQLEKEARQKDAANRLEFESTPRVTLQSDSNRTIQAERVIEDGSSIRKAVPIDETEIRRRNYIPEQGKAKALNEKRESPANSSMLGDVKLQDSAGAINLPVAPDAKRNAYQKDIIELQEQSPAAAAALTPQLKPAGRLSLAVEIPQEGTTYHFTKLKDHAALNATLKRLPDRPKTQAMWALLDCGVIGLILVFMQQRRRKRQPASLSHA